MATFFSTVTDSAATSCFTTTWVSAATDTIDFGVQWFYEGIDYVQEKIKAIFADRDKVRDYRKSLFTEKIRQSSRIIKKQPYTVMIPSKRNFRGQKAQRK